MKNAKNWLLVDNGRYMALDTDGMEVNPGLKIRVSIRRKIGGG
jgi:hypothetical protein